MNNKRGFAQIPLILGLLLMAIAVPLVTKLAQQNADNRNRAADVDPCAYVCGNDSLKTACDQCRKSNQPTAKPSNKPTTKPEPTKDPKYCIQSLIDHCPNGCEPTKNGGTCKSFPTEVPKATPTVDFCKTGAGKTGGPVICTGSGKRSRCGIPFDTCASGRCASDGSSCYVAPTPTKKPGRCGSKTSGQVCVDAKVYKCNQYGDDLPVYAVCQSGACAPNGVDCLPPSAVTPTPIKACSGSDGCSPQGNVQSCSYIYKGMPGVPDGTKVTGTHQCNFNYFSQCLNWSECKPGLSVPTSTPTTPRSATMTPTKVPTARPTEKPPVYCFDPVTRTYGVCQITPTPGTVCNRGTSSCVDINTVRVCKQDQSGYTTADCAGNSTCQAGTCLATPTKVPGGGGPTSPPVNNCAANAKGKLDQRTGIWIYLDDEASAKCICVTKYHQKENGKWYCGSGGNGGGTTVTPTPNMNKCTQCPADFKCYKSGNEYRWFVTGYVQQGFVASTTVNCGGVPKPTFLGKGKGDATCDGRIDTADYSLWHKEFYDGNAGTKSSKTWHADFTGPGGVCDGKVDTADYSLWHKYFYELIGNN